MNNNRVLLIDDDELFLFLVRKVLNNISAVEHIHTVSNARDGLDFLHEANSSNGFPDIVFIDINMPGINGMEFAKRFSDQFSNSYPNTHLFMLTSSSNPKLREEALRIPVVKDVISKPLTPEKFNIITSGI